MDTLPFSVPTHSFLLPDPHGPAAVPALRGTLSANDEDTPPRRRPRRPASALPAGLDEVDVDILRELQSNGRISNMKLADAVGLSPDVARERMHRLVREGFILGYKAVLNADKLSAGMLVFTEVHLEDNALHTTDAFRAAVKARPEILECHEVAGGFDYLLKSRVADMQSYGRQVAPVIWQLPGVRETRTYAVMEELKNTARLAL